MNQSITLDEIFIGKADGFAEARRKDFDMFFYNGNRNYTLLKEDREKFIVSGRKGTGKTILAKYYEKELKKEKSIVKFVNGNDILLRHIKEIGTSELDDKCIPSFIKYTILSEIATELIDNEEVVLKKYDLCTRRYVKKIYKNLKEIVIPRKFQGNFSLSNFSKEIEEDVSAELSNVKFSGRLNSKIAKIKTENYTKNSYFSTIDRLERLVLFIIQKVDIAIILDDIDEYAEKLENNVKFNFFLVKLIEVIYEINNDIYENTEHGSKIVLLLRSDIIERLQVSSTNINKIIVDSQILLNWIGKTDICNPENNPLFDMILNKIQNSNAELKKLTKREVYDRFFPQKINDTDTIRYIFRRSHGRPRDVVNLLNIIKKENPNATRFEAKFFVSAEKDYSRTFKDELKNEASLMYDGNIISTCFQIISFIGKTTFSMKDVENVILESKEFSNITISAKEFIDIMYGIGAIGNYRKISGKASYFFKYREDGCEEPNYRDMFIVHQALRRSLLRK